MTKNKLSSILLSLTIAFGLWLYVVTNISIEDERTYHDIPVSFEGEIALEERGLMITEGTNATVDLRLYGARDNLNKLTSSNITIQANLARIYDVGQVEVNYEIYYPGDVPSNAFTEQSKSPSTIKLMVEERIKKDVPVTIEFTGSVPEEYLCDTDNVILDQSYVTVVGPASTIDQIEQAMIQVDLEDRTETITDYFQYILCNADGEPVDVDLAVADVGQIRMELAIRRFKELPVTYTVVEGGGATEENAEITLDNPVIRVSGSDILLEQLTEINLGTINLGTIHEDTTQTFAISLPEGVINLSGVGEVNVGIRFKGLATREFTVENIRVTGVPGGMEYELVTKRLTLTLRGPADVINKMTDKDLFVTADLSGKDIGTVIVNAGVSTLGTAYNSVGALGNVSVSVILKEKAAEETT